jgi:hypothetical protein
MRIAASVLERATEVRKRLIHFSVFRVPTGPLYVGVFTRFPAATGQWHSSVLVFELFF